MDGIRRAPLSCTAFLCCVVFLCIAYFSGVRVNLSGSLPHRLYRIAVLPEGKALSRGELVMPDYRKIDNPAILEGMARRYLTAHPMVKQVGALPGETVLLRDGHFWVDGTDRGALVVLSADSLGRTLGAFPTPYTLKSGEVWLVSHPEKGFDSRYFGPVRRMDITHTATAIF